tara:strand:- start:1603 stop:2067 length:465 start_codon:yes stop_codon:yes gene_type:complete
MATTFNYKSWGKTRSPKNIAGAPGTAVTFEADTTPLLSGTAGYKTAGYATENQRYLHVLFTDLHDTAPAATTVFGYCHAFERWFEIGESNTQGQGDNTARTAATVTVGDSGRAVAAQVPSDREYRMYEIHGIDRVAFVNADATETAVFAACSTF